MNQPDKEATFSIVIPSYNRKQTLRLAINSVLDQTYPYWELIIVDDGSNDGTAEMLKDFQAKDSRIKVITHEVPKERWVSYLDGYRAAKNDWILSNASDDEYIYAYLEQLNHCIKKYDYKIFYYGYSYVSLESSWERPVKELVEDPDPNWGMKHYDHGTVQGMCSVAFHRSCLDAFDGVPMIENFYDLADWFGKRVDQYWQERGLEGQPPIHYSNDDKWCGNPWGDDYVFSWLLTRKYKAKKLDIRPTIAYDRTQDWLYERAIISGTMGI